MLVQLASFLDRSDAGIGSKKKTDWINLRPLDDVHNAGVIFQSNELMALVCWKVNHCTCTVLSFPLVAMRFDLAPRYDSDVGIAVGMGVHGQFVPHLLKSVDHTGKFSSIKWNTKQ